METELSEAASTIAQIGRVIYAKGWVPATSGNFSLRLDEKDIAITVSGTDKGQLATSDIMRVDLNGKSSSKKRASAELGLHLQLYRRDPGIGAVLHTHSLNSTFGSQRVAEEFRFTGMELLKAFDGINSHESELRLPVFENTQDIESLSGQIEQHMQAFGQGYGYVIRGHGLYTWASTIHDCMRHLEALEYLLEYHVLGNGVVEHGVVEQ